MKPGRWTPCALLMTVVVAAVAAPRSFADPAADRHFLDRVEPLLASRCVSCHGPERRKGDLRLDSRPAVLAGGQSGPSVVPGHPEESLLLRAVLHSRPDLEMPPKEKLSPADIAVLDRWIRDGAPWPDPAAGTADADAHVAAAAGPQRIGDAWTDPRNPIQRIFGGQRLDLWSLRPLSRPAVPSARPSRHAEPPGNPIDRFIDARLAEKGWERSPAADRRTLARRLSFDLTGLPPSAEWVDGFVADSGPDAWERLVDTLLASPRYGEHQARQWLDVIRYSDSNGFDWDEFRPQAWRFRDYVIRSFNADKPFDRFVRELLAGDELLTGPPRDDDERDCLVATGYLRLGPQDNSASLFDEQARARAEWMADLTETTGSAFLGLTLSCCRCHDHKFDPLSQADHFRLRAFFEPVRTADDLPLDLADAQEAIRRQHREVDEAIAPLSRRRDAVLEPIRDRVKAERIARLSEDDRRLLARSTDPQPQDFKEQAEAVARKVEPTEADLVKAATEEEKRRLESLDGEIDRLRKTRRPFTRGLLATDTTNAVPATRILFQGDHRAERDPVPPGFPSALDPNPAELAIPRNPATSGRRLTLANWIVASENPLTARVFVNRAWLAFFGRGLVATPNDFGLAGSRPTHPELLDWLAGEFVRSGWSVKRLHRLIVTSATYRQTAVPTVGDVASHPLGTPASAAIEDAANTLLWRQNLRRLSAEQLRDSLLAAAMTLRWGVGGPPVWPELSPDILQANPAFLDDNAEKTKGWYPSAPAERNVRSLYLVQKRTVRVPFLETFDLPENSVSCPVRNVSIVAPQALTLLNGTETLEAARSLAERVTAETGGTGVAAIERVFRLTLQRSATESEIDRCTAFLAGSRLDELCRALLNLNEFAFVE